MEDSSSFKKLEDENKALILKIIKSLHIYREHDIYYEIGLVGLWEASIRFDPTKAQFSTFAYATIKGRILEHLKKEIQYYNHHQSQLPDDKLNVEDPDPMVPFEDDWQNIYCQGLSEKQLKWVQMRITEDKRVVDIAREEGVSTEAVKSWGKAALAKVKANLALDRLSN